MTKKSIKIYIIVFGLILMCFIGFNYLNIKSNKISTKVMNITSEETQNFQSDTDFKKITFKYLIKSENHSINITITDPTGKIIDKQTISYNNPYEKKYDNIKGTWKIDLNSNNNDIKIIESLITETQR